MKSARRLPAVPLPIILFLFARLPLLVALPFDGLRGYGDLLHFYNLASMPGLPYIHYWIEFPPGFAYLNVLTYAITGGVEHVYTYVLVLVLLAADIGNVLLFLGLENLLYPDGEHPTWRSLVYAVLIAALPYAWWYFDSLAVFFTMLAIYWLFSNRKSVLIGGAIGLGILIKLFPALLLPALVRALPPRRSITTAATALALFCIPLVFLYAISPTFTRASLASQSARGSTATVWAILDGNYRAGGFGPLVERLDPTKAYVSTRNPPVIPQYPLLAAFGALGIFLLVKAHLDDPARILSFYGLTLVIFFLWSSGWSPQWIQHLIPIALLVLPLSPGLLAIGALEAVNLLEWPLLLSRGLFYTYPLTILLRLFLLVLLGVLFYQRTRAPSAASA